jgi:hypothetical protein
MSASIFISFAAPDRKVASTLCKALESRGFKCWFSSRDILPGENFQVAIVRAIRKAKVLLLVFTANSNASEEMTKELALASQERLIVVPLRVEDVAPNEAFAYEFATRQWIDFFADWEVAIDQLSERLAQALPPDSQPDPALFGARGDPSARAQALASAPSMNLETHEAAPPASATPASVTPAPVPAEPVAPRAPAAAEPPAGAAPVTVAEAAAAPVKEPAKEPPREPQPKPAPESPAPAAKAPQGAPPKPSRPAPPPAETPQLVRDSIRAEAPIERSASAGKKRTGMLALLAVVVVALIGLGLAAPALFGKKSQADETGMAAVAVAAPPQPPAPVVAAPAEAAPPSAADTADAAAEPAPEPVKVAPRPRKKAPPKPSLDDIPY